MGAGDGDVRAGTTATELGGRRGDRGRVARAEWRGGAADAPSNPPAQAVWSPWGLGVRAGPTVGADAAAAHGLAPGVTLHALEHRVPKVFPSSPV
jgi:hypothetical protein